MAILGIELAVEIVVTIAVTGIGGFILSLLDAFRR